MTRPTDLLAPLDGESPTLYLAAGALLVLFATNTAARVFADAGVETLHSTLGPGGIFVGLVGLFGVYPALARRRSRLAHVAAAVAAVPLVGWFAIAVTGVGSAAGVTPGASVVLPAAAVPVVFLSTLLAYLLFGAAGLRADGHDRTVGLALLAPAVPFLVLVVGVAVLPQAAWLEFLVDGGHALAHLAIGVTLRGRGRPVDSVDRAADATP